MKRKRLKSGLSLLGIAVISLIIGYTIWIPGGKQSEKDNPIAVMLQSGNDWVQASNSSFTQDGYEYDHASCINGSTVTEGENGISIRLTGTDKCTLYYTKANDFKITGITVDGVSQSTVPTVAKYTVTPTCTGATASWNYASWSLDITAFSKSSASCSLAFTTPTSPNYLNSYIISKIGNTTGVAGATTAKGQIVNEKGVRYEGSDPYNYVLFNNELWRVIGVFAFNKSTNVEVSGGSTDCSTYNCYTKIIRNESIGSYAFSALGTSTSAVYNYWENTSGTKGTLNTLLNTYYYNATDGTSDSVCRFYGNTVTRDCDFSKKGIQAEYRPMVQNVTWNLGGYSSATNTQAMYGYERGTTKCSGCANASTGSGYIGLMYPSDYGYSVLSSSCSRTGVKLSEYNTAACGGKAWMLQNGSEWTITPNSSYAYYVWYVNSNGIVAISSISGAYNDNAVRPVLYLSSDVYIVQGSGTKSDPYVLGM